MGPFRWTTRPQQAPARCAISGFTSGRFLDTGVESPYIEPWLYIHEGVLADMARFAGFVPEEELAAANDLIAELEHRNHQLDLQLQEQDQFLDGIDGLVKGGYMLKKAPGRPRKREEV